MEGSTTFPDPCKYDCDVVSPVTSWTRRRKPSLDPSGLQYPRAYFEDVIAMTNHDRWFVLRESFRIALQPYCKAVSRPLGA
jgi:hypothetical protein